ncbi:hypothetical protein HK098_002654 [Nowakowskiella sp. JEL0407]|nr:hypothetical protein HK098_002654 [Nowakowskiella sp. JEL0407]
MPALLDALTDIQLPVIMIGCKSDLKIEGRIDYKLGSKLSAVFGVYFRELSAETKPNDVAVVLEELFTLIVNGPVSRTEGPKYEALKKQLRKMRRESNALNGIATPVMKTPRLDSAKTSTRGNQTITPDSTPNAREIKSSSLHVPKTPSKTNSPRSYSVPAMKSQNGFTSLSEEAKATVQDKSKSNKNDLTDSYELYPGSLSMGFTMDELIERMTCADVQDMEFTKVFLMLYRKFMRPSELLDRLLDRFDEFDNRDAIAHKSATVLHPVQIRVCNVLIHWISEYWADDFTSSKMCFTLEVFLQILHSRPSFAKLASIIQNLVWRDPAPTNENGAYVDWGAEDDDDTISMEEVKESPNPAVNSGRLSDQTIYSDLRAEKPTRERIEEEFSARDSNSLPRMARNGSSSISSFTNRANSWISSLSSNSSSLSRSSMDHRSPTDNAAAGIALQAAQLAGLGPHMSTSTVSTDAIRTLGTRRPSNGSFFSMLNQQYGTSSIDRKHSASSSDKYIWDQQNVRQSATTVAMSRYGDNNSNFSVSGWSTLANRRRSSAGSIDSASLNPAEMGSGITGLGTHMNESNISVFDYPFLEVDEFAIVQQLNLMEYEIFSQIKPRDLLQQIWSRKSKNRYAQSAVASIAHNNFISSWVSTRILSQKKVKSRAKLILKFMRIAKFLRDSNNYNSLFAVMGALSSAAISRLKLTWSYINHQKEEFVDFVQLEMLTNPNHRFQLYRAALRNSEGPCVPYL